MTRTQLTRASGSHTLIQPARPRTVGITIAKHAPVVCIVFGPPAVWALVDGNHALAGALFGTLLPAGLAWTATRTAPLPRDLRKIEAMITVALLFLLIPVLAIPAFMTLGMAPLDAVFEGMSAVTTTGLSVARDPDAWPFAAHVLRAWIQWCGGLAMATAVLALLVSPGLSARKLGDAGMDSTDRIASTRSQARQLLGVYVGLTVGLTLLTLPTIPDAREALVLTLSAVSTGGFAPRSDSLASYSPTGQTMVVLSCVIGSISLLLFSLLINRRWSEAWRMGSIQRVGLALLLLIAACLALTLPRGEGVRIGAVLDLVSAMTTAGFATGAMPLGGPLLVLFLVAMLVGGDVGSTSGGIKLGRIGTLLRTVGHSILTTRLPDSAVAALKQRGKPVSDGALVALLALILLYATTLIAIWSLFLAHGYPPLPALFDTISTLSTVGLSTGVVGPDLSPDLKLALTIAMWLGRLEFIAVLVLILPRTWLKRR